MQEHFTDLYNSYYQRISLNDQMQLFGFAAVYHFGGIWLSPDIRSPQDLEQVAPELDVWIRTLKDCQPAMYFQSLNLETIQVMAATPRHPTMKCVINELLADHGGSWKKIFSLMSRTAWDTTCEPRCCPLQRPYQENNKDVFKVIPLNHIQDTIDGKGDKWSRFSVTISDSAGTQQPNLLEKERRSTVLKSQRCSAGWLCSRCLRTPIRGSLESCRSLCRSCYIKNICVAPSVDRTKVMMEVVVTENTIQTDQKRIPRIIHQTWLEELTTARYPHYQRLQNSWKASGWDYRFYTDEACQEFIRRNYPKRFLDAYDALIPGAFKADLFRLLALFKEGGVYADIDVKLDVDLDGFITKDLSFFVPRDVPFDYWPNSNFCLWNGLMGAAPGHPIIAQAIEDILNIVLNRVDYLDLEGSLCSRDLNTEIWKLRAIPILILTGPCALGRSVNHALGNNSTLQGYPIGWLPSQEVSRNHEPTDYFWGDALTLLSDRYDLGELRFTDVERNLLVASTNQDLIAKEAIKVFDDEEEISSLHYSKSETNVVGEAKIYRDSLVSNEQVRIRIRLTQK